MRLSLTVDDNILTGNAFEIFWSFDPFWRHFWVIINVIVIIIVVVVVIIVIVIVLVRTQHIASWKEREID